METRSKEGRMRRPSEIGYMKGLAYRTCTKHSITAKSRIPSLIKIKAHHWASRSSAGKARIPAITSPVPIRNRPGGAAHNTATPPSGLYVQPVHCTPVSPHRRHTGTSALSPPLIITFHLRAVQSSPSPGFFFSVVRLDNAVPSQLVACIVSIYSFTHDHMPGYHHVWKHTA